MKKLCLILPFLFFHFCMLSQTADLPFLHGELDRARAKASNEGKLYFVYFSADWCMPCQWMAENTFADDSLRAFVTENALAVKVDIDAPLGRAHQKIFGVKILPTILIYNAQGELLQKCEDALPAPKLLSILRSFDEPANRQAQAVSAPLPDLQSALPVASAQVITPTTLPLGEGALTLPELTPAPEIAKPVINASKTYANLPIGEPDLALASPPDSGSAISSPAYCVQLGAFAEYENAQRLIARLAPRLSEKIEIRTLQQNGRSIHKVITGSFPRHSDALILLQKLERQVIKGFVTSMD